MPTVDGRLSGERDFGWMLHDIDFSNAGDKQAKFFHAIMRNGVIDVAACLAEGVVA